MGFLRRGQVVVAAWARWLRQMWVVGHMGCGMLLGFGFWDAAKPKLDRNKYRDRFLNKEWKMLEVCKVGEH